ncbi:hypothetical protein LOD99_7329 [Oopsacas minuta]|uniref:TRUD domain-containing protein n=1 Tax=Oopsacas minuta TaxID=111878 RepID=A0AAV7JUX3_9METZ|nr:hypothetical protein LOD99_7329 [Oopsacas minuta]
MKRCEDSSNDYPSNKRTKTTDQVPEDIDEVPCVSKVIADPVCPEQKIERENLVGITKFANPTLTPFHGVIKTRFSDFHVNEISLEGKTIELTQLGTQSADEQESIAKANPDNTVAEIEGLSSPQLVDELKKIIPENIVTELENLNSESSQDSIVIPLIQEKEIRKNIHFLIKRVYPNLATSAKDNQITVHHSEHIPSDHLRNVGWPKKLPTFCQCVLFKENIDTLQAISTLSHRLNIKQSAIGYAGIKDKRAKTSQLITFRRMNAKRLVGLNKAKSHIKLGNFSYVDKHLKLGDLTGNKFRIVIRNINCEITDLTSSIESLKKNGFVNYFGLQRFGNIGGETHIVGKLILQKRWEDAVNMLLGGERRDEDERTATARGIWRKTHDVKAALKEMPRTRTHEITLLKAIEKNIQANNFQNILQHLPSQVRKLYVHAYQSFLWNYSVSSRLESDDRNLKVGDKVLNGDGDVCTMDEDMINSGKYLLENLVIPTIGEDSTPDKFTLELLQNENIEFDTIKTLTIEYQLWTNYRKVFIKPDIENWSLKNYTNLEETLVLSDLDKIQGFESTKVDEDAIQRTALLLTLSLPKSCYATMALRELLREDTSSSYQATLNAI